MDFEKILSQAWKIIWKHKVLWLFSLLALFGIAGGNSWGSFLGIISAFFALSLDSPAGTPMQASPLWLQNFHLQLQHGFEDGTTWIRIAPIILILILLWLLLSVVFLLVRTVGDIGLVRGAWKADEGQETITFSDLLNEVRHYFWRVLLFSIALSVLGALVAIILFLPMMLVFFLTMGCGIQCLMPLFIAISWFLQALVEMTMVAIVGEDLDIMQAIKRTWGILTGNLGAVALMSVILFLSQIILANLSMQPLLLAGLPGFIGILAGTKVAITVGLLISGLGFIIYILLSILFYSVMRAFLSTVWTLVFRRLTGHSADEMPAPADDAPEEPSLPETAAA